MVSTSHWPALLRCADTDHAGRLAENVEFYASNGVPFVVGTTGGDREKLLRDAQAAGSYAVIAPQMGKQVHCDLCTYAGCMHDAYGGALSMPRRAAPRWWPSRPWWTSWPRTSLGPLPATGWR
jgi:hypothetical protein